MRVRGKMGITFKKEKIETATGGFNSYFKRWDVNLSGILSFFIKEAAKCAFFSSDLFIAWQGVEKSLYTELYGEQQFFFGFREMGVDHLAFIDCKYNPEKTWINPDYRVIYMLEGTQSDDDITFTLYKIEVTGYESD